MGDFAAGDRVVVVSPTGSVRVGMTGSVCGFVEAGALVRVHMDHPMWPGRGRDRWYANLYPYRLRKLPAPERKAWGKRSTQTGK